MIKSSNIEKCGEILPQTSQQFEVPEDTRSSEKNKVIPRKMYLGQI